MGLRRAAALREAGGFRGLRASFVAARGRRFRPLSTATWLAGGTERRVEARERLLAPEKLDALEQPG